VILASAQNNLYALDAVTGVLLRTRNVQTPFLMSDIGCTDIPDYIGIMYVLTVSLYHVWG